MLNIYNNCKHNETISALTEYHRKHANNIMGNDETQGAHHLLWLGNFNRHHPYRDAPENSTLFTRETLSQAEILIQSLAEVGLEMALEAGVPTHKHYVTKRRSRLDHVFSTDHTIEAITCCEALPDEQGVSMDHFPILTVLNLKVPITGRAESKEL